MKKVLLLNPPWKNNRIVRDGYCSHTSKGAYLFPPLDLLMISGILAKKHNVSFLDCVAERLDYEISYDKLINIKPDVIISLTSTISFKEDLDFLEKLKNKFNCIIVLMGDITYFESKFIMKKYQFIDGILLDYTSDFILKFIDSKFKNLKDVVYREKDRIIVTKKSDIKKFNLPIPKHELAPLNKYSMPYGESKLIAHTITAYGCPYHCSFCIAGKIPYKERRIQNVISELKHIKKIGINELIFRDYSFNANPKRCKEICREMIKNKLNLKWSCELTVINSDAELLNLMKKAGCYLILVGIESADDNILKESRKPLTTNTAIQFLRLCKKISIKTVGHFIFGLPNDTKESINKTIDFSKKIGCDYASFNLYIPRVGSDLRAELIKNKKTNKEDLTNLDCSTNCAAVSLPKDKLFELKRKAIKKFYFRPSQIIKQIYLIRTWTQFRNLVRNGYQLFLDNFNMNKD